MKYTHDDVMALLKSVPGVEEHLKNLNHEEILAKCTPDKKHEEIDWGKSVDK